MTVNYEWKFVGAVAEGQDFDLEGLDVWKNQWNKTSEVATVVDPHHQDQYEFPVYEIGSGSKVVSFAAGQFSNSIFGFFIKQQSSRGTGRRRIITTNKR